LLSPLAKIASKALLFINKVIYLNKGELPTLQTLGPNGAGKSRTLNDFADFIEIGVRAGLDLDRIMSANWLEAPMYMRHNSSPAGRQSPPVDRGIGLAIWALVRADGIVPFRIMSDSIFERIVR
jgi:hypothetical protein